MSEMYLKRIAESLELLLNRQSSGRAAKPTSMRERRMQALALMVELDGNLTAIAKQIGCSRTTLQKDKTLVRLIRQWQTGRDLLQGSPRLRQSTVTYDEYDHE